MNNIKSLILILGMAVGIGLVSPMSVQAAGSVISEQCAGVTDSTVCSKQNDQPVNLTNRIVNLLLFIVGALSVIMIIVGGLLYATSAGDSGRVTMAKNTLMYAVVGLVVSFLAFAVVQYVVTKFTT